MYVPGRGSKSKCVSAEADKSVWCGSRKFRNAFQNGTNSFLKILCTFLFSWTIFEDTFLFFLINVSIFAEYPMVVAQSYNSLAGAYVRGPDL